jgi:cell fate regulator YaaT (PSP1 superfamily)
MCCLAYEAQQYQEVLEKMPSVGTEIETAEGKGVVKKINVLKNTVTVELAEGSILDIPVEDLLKNI